MARFLFFIFSWTFSLFFGRFGLKTLNPFTLFLSLSSSLSSWGVRVGTSGGGFGFEGKTRRRRRRRCNNNNNNNGVEMEVRLAVERRTYDRRRLFRVVSVRCIGHVFPCVCILYNKTRDATYFLLLLLLLPNSRARRLQRWWWSSSRRSLTTAPLSRPR